MSSEPGNRDNLPVPAINKYRRDRRKVLRGLLPKLRRLIAWLPFADTLLSAYYAAMDRKTPLRVKAALMAALAYFVTPTDLIPDFLGVLGYGDDAAVLFATVRLVADHITPEHKEKATEAQPS